MYRCRFKNKNKGVVTKQNIPLYTLYEFNEMVSAGRKVVLYNNFIVDIDSFADQHPGTTYVLTENIGKDIGKYFYGAYSMSPDIVPYTHSSYAAKLLEKLVIGKMKPMSRKSMKE